MIHPPISWPGFWVWIKNKKEQIEVKCGRNSRWVRKSHLQNWRMPNFNCVSILRVSFSSSRFKFHSSFSKEKKKNPTEPRTWLNFDTADFLVWFCILPRCPTLKCCQLIGSSVLNNNSSKKTQMSGFKNFFTFKCLTAHPFFSVGNYLRRDFVSECLGKTPTANSQRTCKL